MTTTTNNTAGRKQGKIFPAMITPATIETGTTSTGKAYAKMQGAEVVFPDGSKANRTVMAFGDQYSSVSDVLVTGNQVKLAIQRDGGTFRVIGHPLPPREQKAA